MFHILQVSASYTYSSWIILPHQTNTSIAEQNILAHFAHYRWKLIWFQLREALGAEFETFSIEISRN